MSQCKIHNVGFYKPDPRAIYSMAINTDGHKLAISRSDASIEIWNLNNLLFIERTIAPSLENFSIEGLCWCHNRLFSVGLHGLLIEYDLYKLCVGNKWVVTGESATCLDINKDKSCIAIGTEHGYLNLFQITENGADFEKFLDKQEGRIVCVKFDSTGKFLVTGSVNAVRIWSVSSGHAIHRMQLGRSEAKKDTVVWCLEVLSDFTLFTGDSRGVLTLWDGNVGAQIENYQSHKADITALCLSPTEDSVYCAGVDPLITNYVKVKVKGQTYKWIKSIHRKIHDHDVRAMVLFQDRLYSGGVDSYLACSYHPPKTLIKFAPIMQSPCVQVASKAKFILLRYPKHIEIWSLAETEKTEDHYRGAVQLKTKPKKLVAIQKIGKNWDDQDEGEGVICTCISSDGKWIFLSTNIGYSLYKLCMVNNQPNLTKVDDLDDSNTPCVQAVFNDKKKQLICAVNNGNMVIYDLGDGKPFIIQTIASKKDKLTDTVTFLTVSNCGHYLIAGDPSSNIAVWSKAKDGWAFYAKLPRYGSASPTAMAVNPNSTCLVVAYADSTIMEYDLKKRELTNFSGNVENELPSNWNSRTYPIRSISFDSRKKTIIIMHDDSSLIVIDKDKKSNANQKSLPKVKKTKLNLVNEVANSTQKSKIRCIQKYKHLVYLGSIAGDELVAVEVNPLLILEKLPPAFAQKTFGSK